MSCYQVYCDNETGVNHWLRENHEVEIVDIKVALNDDGELVMVVYKETK